jgi:hypothetical protein
MFNCKSKKHCVMSLIAVIKPDLVSQTRQTTDSEHLGKFRTQQLDVLKLAGGNICSHSGMREDELVRADVATRAGTDVETTAATLAGRQRFEAASFLAKQQGSGLAPGIVQ